MLRNDVMDCCKANVKGRSPPWIKAGHTYVVVLNLFF